MSHRLPVARLFTIRRSLSLCMAALLVGGAALLPLPQTAHARDYPEPSFAPVSWELEFEWRSPKRIEVRVAGQGTKAYWYMPYTVTNDTDEERHFFPEIVLVDANGIINYANFNIPVAVFDAVKQRTRSLDVQPSQDISGRLLIGDDQAKDGVAIWAEPTPEMGTFDIFVGGLSGEVVRITDSTGSDLKDADGKPILVRKTRHLRFKVRGDDVSNQPDDVTTVTQGWVMR